MRAIERQGKAVTLQRLTRALLAAAALCAASVPGLAQSSYQMERCDTLHFEVLENPTLNRPLGVVRGETRDRKAAFGFLKKAMKRHGRPEVIVTDRAGLSGQNDRFSGRAS